MRVTIISVTGQGGEAERQQGGAAPTIDPAAETACTAR